jgi:hypothetical protein
MNKLCLIPLFFSNIALAQPTNIDCSQYLSSYQDSHAFRLTNINEEINTVEAAQTVILKLLKNHCITKKIKFTNPDDTTKNGCNTIVANNFSSFACYVEADIGYFFITEDLMENVFVIWNRWD